MSDEEEFPRRKKFYFGSPANTPWNNDLFVKQASKTELKYTDPQIAKRNKEIWKRDQERNINTPDYFEEEALMSVRSTGTRTAKKIRKSRGIKSVIREELKGDIDELHKEVKSAVEEAKKRNKKLDELVALVGEISADQNKTRE
jgi:hypothetical protein